MGIAFHKKTSKKYVQYTLRIEEDILEKIKEIGIVKKESIIIVETDDEQRILKEIGNIEIKIVDKRKYGRATIIFLEI